MKVSRRAQERFSVASPFLVLCACLMATSALAASPAAARTVYVRTGGNDALDGSTPAAAVLTIARATALAAADDDIVVGPGLYHEGNIQPAVFGRVRLLADRRGTATGDTPGDVVIDATGFVTGFDLDGQLAVTIDGFVIYGASIGIYVKSHSHQAVVSNNIVSGCSANGIYVQDSRGVVVFNNLVYNNARTGILITGSIDGSAGAVILNNTVYLNGNRGIFFSGTDIGSPNGLALNNIVESNAVAGFQVNETSRDGYLSAGNVSFDNRYASGAPIDVTDIEADAMFVNPAGGDGILGGTGYADDDFHLSDRRAGQLTSSAAIDAGSDVARRLSLYHSSTRSDGKFDRGYVDAGYHYYNYDSPPSSPQQRLRPRRLYVSATRGSDDNNGSTRGTPVSTLGRALALARPGHQITLLGGTYREGGLIIGSSASGKLGRPIIVKGMGRVTIDASGAQHGLTLTSVRELIIEGVAVTGAQDNGIEVHSSSATDPNDPSSLGIVLRGCRLSGNGKRGLSVRDSTGIAVESCRVESNGERGIQIENSDVRIEHSVVRHNGTSGLWAFDGSTVALTRTDFIDNPQEGVLVEDSALSMLGGTLSGSKDGGARFRASSTGVLDAVIIVDNRDLGVQATSSSVSVLRATVRRNRIGVLGFVDTQLRTPNAITIENTMICDGSAAGIDVQDTALKLRDTTVCSNGSEGLRQARGSSDIEGGNLKDNETVGVSLSDVADVAIVETLVTGNHGDGVQLDNCGARIERATVRNNGRTGLWAFGGSLVSIDHSDFVGNPREGLLVEGSDVSVYAGTLQGGTEGGARFLAQSRGDLQDVVVVDNQDTGVEVVSSAVSVTGSTIERNRVGVLGGVDLMLAQPNQITIDDAVICDSGASGIDVQDTAMALKSTLVCSNGDDGLRQKGGAVDIDGCTFRGNTARGASIADAASVATRDMAVASNGNNGFQVVNSGSVSLINADVFDNIGDGVSVLNSSVREVRNSRVYGNGSSGILVQGNASNAAALQVLGASAYGNGQNGFRLSGGSVHFENSSFADNASSGISLTNTQQVSARDIEVARNGDNGLEIAGAESVSVVNAALSENAGDGLTILETPSSEISNSLVYGNGSTGILISGTSVSSPAARVIGSTVYGNVNRGLFLSGSTTTPSATAVVVLRNIFRNNGNAGVQVNTAPLVAYSGDYNLNTDPYGALTPVGNHDILRDPQFVDPAAGNFRLSQPAAGQAVLSPAVNAGGVSAVTAGMNTRTTRTDSVPDAGIVDIGYHYPPPTPTPAS